MRHVEMRSSLVRALGLGSAKTGAGHWWAQRVSAVALIPLTLWFVASLIAHTGSSHASFLAWLGTPLNSIAMILLLLALFHHIASGLQVVIEDYMHSRARFAAVLVMRLTCMAFATAGVLATLHVSLVR